MKTIALCSSLAFYKHLNEVASQLERLGFNTTVPETAAKMNQTGDYSVEKHKTWYENKDTFHIKKRLLDTHIEEVEAADAILVVNDSKNGIEGYIGGNVMIEIAIAYYLKKPIFILNDVPKSNPVYEEIIGMDCKILNGKLSSLET